MKREWIMRLQDMLVIVMNHLLFVAVALTVLDLFDKENTKLLLWAVMVIVPVFYYYVRIKAEKIPVFYAVHLFLCLGFCLIPAEQITKALMIVIVLFYSIWSIYLKMSSKMGKQELIPAPFVIVLIGILEMIEKIRSKNDWAIYYLIIAFVYLLAYFIHYFVNQYIQFVALNEKSAANMPKRELFSYGIRQVCVFCAGSVLILLLAANLDWFSKIMSKIWGAVVAFLRSIISGMEPPAEGEETITPTLPDQMDGNALGEGETLLPEFLLDLIEKAAILFVSVIFVAAVIAIIVLIYKFIKGHFLSFGKKKEEELLENNQDIRENCGIEKSKKKKESWFRFLNNREKIRKVFRKKVLKSKQELIGDRSEKQLEYFTAKECCDRLEEQNLKLAYEKARYSEEDITAEDMKRIKSKM